MRLVFLFLTRCNHHSIDTWNRFFDGVPTDLYSIYCHPKNMPSQRLLLDNTIHRRVPTQWGDISLVKATLLLLRTALRDPENGYFILVSDSCIPIVDFDFLYAHLHETLGKRYSYLAYTHRENRLTRYEKLHPGLRQHLPWKHFYSQHQWMILNRHHVERFVESSLIPAFQRVHAADEHYFIACFYLWGILDQCINHKTTYCDWSDTSSDHPRPFSRVTHSTIMDAQAKRCFFLRKVSRDCQYSPYLDVCIKYNPLK